MSKEKLLSALDKLKSITENLSKNGVNKIAKMQNLSLNKLEQITEINNFSENKVKQIAEIRHIKNYKDMSKKDLLIALLKSNQSHAELLNSKYNNAEIEETKNIFNELRNNFSKEEIKNIRRKFRFKEGVDEYLEELEKKDNLTKKEKQEKKHYIKKLRNTEEFLKDLRENLNKLKKHRYNIIDDVDYKGIKEIENLFNKINEEYYFEPIKTKHAFNDSYIEYESRGDKDNNLSLVEYLDIIRPYLRDMIDNHKIHSEWKTQLIMRINFISSLDKYEFRILHTKSDNIEIMNCIETNDIINELFKSFIGRYQERKD